MEKYSWYWIQNHDINSIRIYKRKWEWVWAYLPPYISLLKNFAPCVSRQSQWEIQTFTKRSETNEITRRKKIETRRIEVKYNEKVDITKKQCQKCKNVQRYSEFMFTSRILKEETMNRIRNSRLSIPYNESQKRRSHQNCSQSRWKLVSQKNATWSIQENTQIRNTEREAH